MPRKAVILDSAKAEFRDIQQYVRQEFGAPVWNTVNAEYKKALQTIQRHPEMGHGIAELQELGITHIRYALVRQTRMVYEFDDRLVIIHMFISPRRDFRRHLFARLLHSR